MEQQPQAPPIDLNQLTALRTEMEALNKQKKTIKTRLDDVESRCIEALMAMRVRYVDVSNTGQGPYYTLSKKKTEGSWSKERYIDFFNWFVPELQAGRITNTGQCMEAAMKYLEQFSKRTLTLNKVTAVRSKTIDDLEAFLNGKD